MKRPTLTAAFVAALICSGIPVLAQVVPGDSGAGQERGMQEMNTSGQVGTVTLFSRGEKAAVVLDIKSEPPGRHQPAHIHRGKACDASIDPNPAYELHDVVGGRSVTLVPAPEAKLLSGNYVVLVHASSSMEGMHHYVSCGQLYH
jgi:hypothetical protein